MTKLIPENRCNRCGGTGYDPEPAETYVYTENGDVDVQFDPVICSCCEGTCKDILSEKEKEE